jgi:hypothetical protein
MKEQDRLEKLKELEEKCFDNLENFFKAEQEASNEDLKKALGDTVNLLTVYHDIVGLMMLKLEGHNHLLMRQTQDLMFNSAKILTMDKLLEGKGIFTIEERNEKWKEAYEEILNSLKTEIEQSKEIDNANNNQ